MKKVSELKSNMKITLSDFSYTKKDFFICGRCNQEWEHTFICEKCSSGEEPIYDAIGYETDNPVCIDTCYNCCNCHEKD